MTRYRADSRERVREAVDMIALVSARTELRQRGANSYFGLCPFHQERTPSFHVSPDDKLYHCFGCQASGDAFSFVMETEGLDFSAALESLADRFGVQLEREAEDPEAVSRRARRERLQSLLGRAAAFYSRYLWEAREAAAAREYLLGRKLSEEILREFRIGYAPSAWDRLQGASRSAGFSDEELLAAGLAQASRSRPGQIYDRFRERIMFPSADARGRVVGFGARGMRSNQPPKYLNTAEGELYHKRRQLFGIDLARSAAARSGRMILVEGYTDVLALHQAGLRNSVAIMGTSLTEEQVAELERIAGVLELCLDADRAGQEAMLRAARLAAGRELELRVVPLPPGEDPAELFEREEGQALQSRVEGSVPFVVFQVERILERTDTRNAEGKDRAIAQLRPVLAQLPPSVMREELLRRVAGRLELSEGRLASLLPGGEGARGGTVVKSPPSDLNRDPVTRAERAFLVLCIALPEDGRRALAAIDPDQHLTSELLRRAARHLAGQAEMPMTALDPGDEQLARVVADLVRRAGLAGPVIADQLEHQRLLLERSRLDRALRRAREEGAGVGELAHEREQVLAAIQALDERMEEAV